VQATFLLSFQAWPEQPVSIAAKILAIAMVLGLSVPMRALALFLLPLASSGTAVTPVEKVMKLLKDLKDEVEADGSTEAKSYASFACFCEDTTHSKSLSIKTGQDTIDVESATIAEKTATKETKLTDLDRRQLNQEEMTKELSDAKTLMDKEKAAYTVTDADLSKAISSLENALKALNDSKPTAFLALRKSVEKSLVLADALHLMQTPRRKALGTLLQQKVDPDSPEYKFHSQGIIDTLDQLLTEFRAEKLDADAEWAKAKLAHEATISSLDTNLGENRDAIVLLKSDIDVLIGDVASSRENLVYAEAELKDDQTYLKDLTELCEARAKDWDQRSKQRAQEFQALTEALAILRDGVKMQDVEVNKRALLLSDRHSRIVTPAAERASALSFLEVRRHGRAAESTGQRRESGSISVGENNQEQAVKQRLGRAAVFLEDEGRRLKSVALSAVASRAGSDPFAKVKVLIQKLLERLLAESTAEATKKSFCDEELGKANQDRDYRLADAQDLNAELAVLEAKEDHLVAEIDALDTSISELKESLANADHTRKTDKAANLQTLSTAREGLRAIKEAIGVLKAFYKQAAKAKVGLLQASPVEVDTQGPGFEGAYTGKQEASSGIIGLLEVIKSDFERTISTTTASEKQAASEFVEFDRASKADIKAKETKKELDEEDLETSRTTIAQKTSDLKAAMDLLDGALQVLETLKPTCVDLTMPYETRVQKREEELAALKRALCILDTNDVEEKCTGTNFL